MGCSFFWNATEEDIFRQRRCGWYLETMFGGCFKPGRFHNHAVEHDWDCQTYDGYYTGYFLDLDDRENIAELSTLRLIGTTFYYGWMSDLFDGHPHAVRRRQFSFVFDNSYRILRFGMIMNTLTTNANGGREYTPNFQSRFVNPTWPKNGVLDTKSC